MRKLDDDFKGIIDALLTVARNDNLKENKEVYEQLKDIYNKSSDFWTAIAMGQYKFNGLVESVLEIPPQKNAYIVEFLISGLYKHFFQQLMQKTEGSAYCADKATFIKNMTIKALYQKENISLFEDYTKTEQIKKDKEKQAYWSPKTVPDTDIAMTMFWDWYWLRSICPPCLKEVALQHN